MDVATVAAMSCQTTIRTLLRHTTLILATTLAANAQIVRYYVVDMFFDDGAEVTGFLDYDVGLEQVTNLEFYHWEPTNPPDPVEIAVGFNPVSAPYYFDQEPDEPYLQFQAEDQIDFQSGTLLQVGGELYLFNLQLETSLLDGSQIIAAAITDGVLQGSYQTASVPFNYWGFGYSGYYNFERSLTSGYLSQTAPLSAVPEPAHTSLALGLGCFGYLAWRRRQQSAQSREAAAG